MDVAPQLEFGGNCRQAFEYYARHLGGEISVMNTFGGNKDHRLPPGSNQGPDEKIRFAEIRFGGSALRGNDVPEGQFAPMCGFNVSMRLTNAEAARRMFDALADGGIVTTPLSEVSWAELFGMVVDQFGVPWLILVLKR